MRRNEYIIKIYLKSSDKAKIAENARECGLSMSAFVRSLALGDTPVTNIELDEMNKVMKIHADLGRLGGLLKMTLTNEERLQDMGREMGVATIEGTLVDIRATQAKLLELVDIVLKKARG